MLRLSSEITIESQKTWFFTYLANCNVVQDTGTLTDTCTLELPKNIKWEGYLVKNGKLPIKRGDRITIKLGYDDDLTFKFSGFIRSVDAKNPVKIHCEDGMFLLKTQKAPAKSYKDAMLKDVIGDLLEGTNIEFQLIDNDVKLGKYRITQPTVAQALQELKEKHMLSAYFRTIDDKSVLYVGLTYPFDHRKKEKFVHGKNIISEEFEYRDKEEIRAKVEATSFGAKHKKTYLEVGDKDGDVIKIRIDGLTESELKKYAENTLDKYKQTGFKGSFEAFGEPIVSKCDMVEVHASDGNSGTYLIKKNEINFGMNGYRQKIELGQPLGIEKR
ncbi:hypothetical protein E5F92_002285 [Flavobacterium columnare]|uniref:hypothetical protein n=1 Tax=Flavobacterium columnare TaxID=996 RepID=UPI00107E9D74|nr:hypothetical protein [Flavobacterium columnare]MCH4831578.1 hypothetical protein [Flavobacterium columnare]